MTVLLRTAALKGPSIAGPDGFAFFLDMLDSEEVSLTAEATQFPLEDGASFSDHIIDNPDKLTLVAGITNSPESDPSRRPDRDFAGLEELEFFKKAREPLTIVTKMRTYTSMALVSIVTGRDSSTGQAIFPRLDFEQIATASQELAQVPASALAASVQNSGTTAADLGRQGTEPAAAATEKKGTSILAGLFGGRG